MYIDENNLKETIVLIFFREKFAREMEEYTRLLYERTQTSKIAKIWTCRTETEEIHVFRSIAVSHADGGKQKVLSIDFYN